MANTFRIVRDAVNKQFVMETVDETGAVVRGVPRVILTFADIDVATTVFRFGNLHYTDTAGNPKVAPAIIGQAAADSSDPNNDTAWDLRIGGGGVGGTLQSIVICVEGVQKTISYYGLPPV